MRHLSKRGFPALLSSVLVLGSAGQAFATTHRPSHHVSTRHFSHHASTPRSVYAAYADETVSADDLNSGELSKFNSANGFSASGSIQPSTTPARHAIAFQGTIAGQDVQPKPIETGVASWYGKKFRGRVSADGTVFDEHNLTAAHRWLPLGSKVRVTLADSGRYVDVTITDRPGTRKRVIDLSRGAAAELGIISQGTAKVTLSQL
ncbi:septal ring lytic transglycosylase RlpA family protein [Granulibacter bethesdensis]|uniref:Endolytic peptidoglycan transglycosylase RlpA n=1 Tax=Granulibacter bethesdensis (strain ATCC BAA-1260 / CGDNIH1) TaxID=391165 RepID=Q0BQW6_GRABC|nr:septal ring lytic transglycosylase RlpA family protein [Granulibacter bethesdensis]ABI62786.1 Lipoprotein [Granulibacter bethesdensis CGDNIH1]APH52649.1 Lipoprotein [Granulibacter bethesdensis]APH65338.1 Lipoprotein [Granulibacter bethesdensis]